MGHIVKYIMGENPKRKDPKYDEWTIEKNADGKIHIHLRGMRMDLTIAAYNQFYDVIKTAHDEIYKP